MATDAREHTVPAATGNPARSDLLGLSKSIRDIIPVASAAAQATKLTALSGEGITPSTSNPILFYRADADTGAEVEITTNGSTFKPIPSYTSIANRTMSARRTSDGTFASGSMASLTSGSLGASAPAGLYLVTWTWILSCTAVATGNLRGQFAGVTVTNDEAVDVLTTRQVYTLVSRVTHTGGSANLTQYAQVSTGTGNARAGCKIDAIWMGPA